MTTQTTQEAAFEPFRATVDARILDELPRFFPGSLDRMLAEILQNAHRAGASLVEVVFDDANRMLVIGDDGRGIEQPQIVLQAGCTGWDEGSVVEPAGVGFFSLLDDRLVESVIISSRDWELFLQPHDRDGREVRAELADVPMEKGTKLEITLAESARTAKGERLTAHRLRDELLPKARALYPFKLVQFDYEPEHPDGVTILSPPFKCDLAFNPPYGSVQWKATDFGVLEPVWEWAFVGRDELKAAMQRAAEGHPFATLAKAIVKDTSLRWFIDPNCGVRPVLPHRNALQPGEALNEAAHGIVHALVERILLDARVESGWWTDRIPDLPEAVHQWPLEGLYWARSAGLRRAVLEHLGWVYVDYTDLDEHLSLWRDYEDSLNVDATARSFHDRRALLVRSQALACSLNVHDVPAVWEPTLTVAVPEVEIRIENLRLGKGLIAACDSISVLSAGREPIQLKFLVTIEDEFDLPEFEMLGGRAIVFAGDSRALWREMQGFRRLTNAAFLYSYYVSHDEWYEWVDGTDVLESEIQDALIDSFIADFEQSRRGPQIAWHASADAAEHLREAQLVVQRAQRALKRRNMPKGFKGTTSLTALARDLKRAIALMSREARKWQTATGLADDSSDDG